MFRILFMDKFEEFITPRIIELLYTLSMVACFIVCVGAIVVSFASGVGDGILASIVAIPVFFLVVLYLRVISEFVIVVFKIEANTKHDD